MNILAPVSTYTKTWPLTVGAAIGLGLVANWLFGSLLLTIAVIFLGGLLGRWLDLRSQ